MSLIQWSPLYEPFLDVERALESVSNMHTFSPAVDVYERDNKIIAEIALSGIDPKDVSINIEDNALNVMGRTEKRSEIDEKQYYRKEVRTGSFHRVINLPTAVDGASTTAEYDNGILKISMPKKEEKKSKPISITIKK